MLRMEAAQWGPKAEVEVVDHGDFLPHRGWEPWQKEQQNLDYTHAVTARRAKCQLEPRF
jgi:hypothetical protein